ncbi:anti-sigma factor [Planctomyces sp. SH-PL14]|uniref:anti-sigma factor n=1 Tax=Planctomyces sp. SH-PL14 TaxID=1632864 RepID=UPI00078C11C8|nr:anti-sigma factor [Planctomyces sp. SH-PL14]AMV17877.1 hypothetical protein VT03_08285 [Planctomyces sp. SH-PL14]
MNPDDPLEDWIASRRSPAPPPDLADRVMNTIAPEPQTTGPSPRRAPPRMRDRLEAAACLLLFVCSLVVAVVRLASLAGVVVPSSGDEPAITREFFEDESHVRNDVT